MLQTSSRTAPRKSSLVRGRFQDEARFLRSWIERPLITGAVAPSGKVLAKAMAAFVNPHSHGPVIELGPGTGPMTEAILRRGIAQDRLVLVEFNPEFCRLLQRRFPRAQVVQGDAYNIRDTLEGIVTDPACAVLSSLPLFTKPLEQRLDLLNTAFDLMQKDAPFIQFTYAVNPPIPKEGEGYRSQASSRIWLNIPPARVWAYRRA